MSKTTAAGAALAIPLGLLVVAVIGGFISLVVAWPVMVLLGNAAISSAGAIPSLGYWTVFWLTWAIMFLTTKGS